MRSPGESGALLSLCGNSELSQITLDPGANNLLLRFERTPDHGTIDLRLLGILLLSFANSLADEDVDQPPYMIGEAVLTELRDGGRSAFRQLRYGFRDLRGRTLAYPGRRLYHCHVEGAIVLDAICLAHSVDRHR